MREHIISWGGTDKRQTENAKVEASLNLRLAESGAKNHLNIAQNQRLITVREIAGILKWDYVFVLISD